MSLLRLHCIAFTFFLLPQVQGQVFQTFYPEPLADSIPHSRHALPYQLPRLSRYAPAAHLPQTMRLQQIIGDSRWMLPIQGWSIAYSPAGDLIIAGGYNCVVAFEAQSGKRLWTFWGERENYFWSSPVRTLAMHAKQKHLVVGNDAGQVLLLNYQTGKLIKILGEGEGWIMDVAISDDGKYAAACSIKGQLQVWNLRTGRPVALPVFENSRLESLCFHPGNRHLAVGGKEAFALIDLQKKTLKLFPAPNTVQDLLFLDEKNILIAGWEGFLEQWSINDNKQAIWTAKVSENWISRLYRLSPSSLLFTTPFGLGHFDIETQQATLREHLNIRQGLAFHPASKRIAYLTQFGQRIKHSSWPDLARSMSPGDLSYPQLCYSPKGDYLATGNSLTAEQVFLWKLPEGQVTTRFVLPAHQGVDKILFSTNNQLIQIHKRSNNIRYRDNKLEVFELSSQERPERWNDQSWQKMEEHRSMNLESMATLHYKEGINLPTSAYLGHPDSSSINRHLFGGYDLERMYFAAVRNDNHLIVADAKTGELRAILPLPHIMPTACAIHPWDKEVALSSADGLVYIYRYGVASKRMTPDR